LDFALEGAVLEDKNIHPIDLVVGDKLRRARKLAGKTQSDLADVLGISFQQVQKYELGRNRISAGKLYETSQWLGLPISFFFEVDETKPHMSGVAPEVIAFAQSFERVECPELRKKIGALMAEIVSSQDRL